jgi:hypothetical protein
MSDHEIAVASHVAADANRVRPASGGFAACRPGSNTAAGRKYSVNRRRIDVSRSSTSRSSRWATRSSRTRQVDLSQEPFEAARQPRNTPEGRRQRRPRPTRP